MSTASTPIQRRTREFDEGQLLSPFGEQKKLDVWGSTYNKLFQLFRDDELPYGLKKRRVTVGGEREDVDENRRRVVSEIQQRNNRISTTYESLPLSSPQQPLHSAHHPHHSISHQYDTVHKNSTRLPSAPSPSLQDDVFTSNNASPIPVTKTSKLRYQLPTEMVTVRLPPGEYDYPPLDHGPGNRYIDSSNLLRTVSVSSSISSIDNTPLRALINSHIEGEPLRVSKFGDKTLPSPVVKTTMLRCSNGRKAAIIQVDEIARIIRWIDPSEENQSISSQLLSVDRSISHQPTDRHTKSTVESRYTAGRSGRRRDTVDHQRVTVDGGIAPYERQLIDIVEEKIERGVALDWPELFVIKNAHCRRVIPLEKRLNNLQRYDPSSTEIESIEQQINAEYNRYETCIARLVLCGSPYTKLAHMIMQADAFWFHARSCRDPSTRSDMYRRAIDYYAELLERAETTMEADDVALLTLLQKLTRILAESANFDPQLVVKAALVIDRAEKRLEQKSDQEAARRIKIIRYNLDCVNEAARRHLV